MTDRAKSMAHSDSVISGLFALRVLGAAKSRGIDPVPHLRRLSIDPTSTEPPVLEDAAHLDLWARLMREADDPGLPIHYAEQVGIDDYGLLGLACKTEATLGRALAVLVGEITTLTNAIEVRVVPAPDSVHVIVDRKGDGGLGHRVATESTVAELVKAFRSLVGPRAGLVLGVSFRHVAPAELSAHRAFFACPISFRAPGDLIALDPGALTFPLVRADAAVSSYLQRVLHALPRAKPNVEVPRSASDRAREVMLRTLPRPVRVAGIAKALALSERALQRVLAAEGTTFGRVLDGARKEVAEVLLRGGRRTMTEVAEALGYEDATAFSRAYRRWTGQRPSATRRKQL